MDKLSVLVISDDSMSTSGFGSVIRNMFGGLKALTEDIELAAIAMYPLESNEPRKIDTVKILENDEYGIATAKAYCMQKHIDIIFLLGDWWYWATSLLDPTWREANGIPQKIWYYAPVDGIPTGEDQIKAYRGADLRLAMSPFGKEILKPCGETVYLPHGVNDKVFYPREDKPNRPFTFGIVGRNTNRKNMWAIMAAFKDISKTNKDVRLFIHSPVNDFIAGDLREYVKFLDIEDKVEFTDGQVIDYPGITGYKDEDMWEEVYSNFDCIVSAGREGFGLTFLEAAACGLSLVLPEYSAHYSMEYENAITYEVSHYKQAPSWVMDMHVDIEKLTNAMLYAIDNPPTYECAVAGSLSWKSIIFRLKGLFARHGNKIDPTLAEKENELRCNTQAGNALVIEKSMLLVMPASHGDVMLVTSSAHGLKEKYPEHKLIFVTHKKYFDLVEGCPWIDSVEEYSRTMHDDFILMHKKHDMVFTPHFITQRAANWVHGGHGGSLAEVYAKHCGVELGEYYCPIEDPELDIPQEYITMQVGSGKGDQSARWYNRWREVVRTLKIPVVQIGTKNDVCIDGTIDLRGATSIAGLNFIISNACLHVGIDSYPMHFAAVNKVPSVIIWGNTFPASTGPEPRFHEYMHPIEPTTRSNACPRPCHTVSCTYCNEALNSIDPKKIITEITKHYEPRT